MKKLMTTMMILALLAVLFAGCSKTTDDTEDAADAAGSASGTVVSSNTGNEEAFSDGDCQDVSAQTPDATVALEGDTGTISDTTRGSSGSTVTITSKGVYRVSGSADGVSIVIRDTQESGNIYLVLDNVYMTNDTTACICVEQADKVVIQCVGENSLSYTASSNADGIDGAIYAADDLTVNGSGSLTVSSAQHGIVCKDDLKLTGAALTVTASKIGIQANDSLRIADGTAVIRSGHDGVQLENDEGDSYFYMEGGTLTVDAGYDAIDVGGTACEISLIGGTLELTAGGGSGNSKRDSTSQKGLKCDGSILISGGTVTASCADDAIHSGASISITGGTVAVSSSDDGITAVDTLSISGGTVTVAKSYEGLEAETVAISGGELSVCASDDGINAAGGSDTSSAEQGSWGASSGTGTLNISGGTIYVNAQGDGLDSNGSIYISGGFTVVEGPTDGGNGALDKGDSGSCVASITGGTVLALGSTGMAINFDSGSQCSALVTLSGGAGTTITVDDGSGFSFTASKSFQCAVYSSPSLQQGSSYTISAGGSSAAMNFTGSLYYSTVAGMGGMDGPGRR